MSEIWSKNRKITHGENLGKNREGRTETVPKR